jgi:hypothetical protein
MRGRKSSVIVELTSEQRTDLERKLRSRTVSAGLQNRCRAVVAIADGKTFRHAMQLIGMTDKHLRKWCRRYLENGIDGLNDLPGRGRKPGFSPRGGDPRRETGL